MGSYAEFWVAGLYVTSSKNDVDGRVMSLFRATDKVVRAATSPDLATQVAKRWGDSEDETGEFSNVTYYRAPAKWVRDRLNLYGYTLETAKRLFEVWRDQEVQQMAESDWVAKSEPATSQLTRLRTITADQHIENIRQVQSGNPASAGTLEAGRILADLAGADSDALLGYGGPDMLVAIRLALEAVPDAEEVLYDVTDLVHSGYFSDEDDIVEKSLRVPEIDYVSSGRIIVITEGKSDAAILKSTMLLLRPHLADYFLFMDFDEFRVGGGAGSLANLVKAFSGAGIVNRIIALFDNDTASDVALATLRHVPVPKNIVPMKLPENPALRSYPTLGPSGLVLMDVNGMAASIELYLGEDVIRDSDGKLSPIQWTGYESSVRRYQGALLDKAGVQDRFRTKLERCRSDPTAVGGGDWTGLELIVQQMVSAFQELDREQLTAMTVEYYQRA